MLKIRKFEMFIVERLLVPKLILIDDEFISFYVQFFSHRMLIIIITSMCSRFFLASFFCFSFSHIFASTLFGTVHWFRFDFIHDLVGPISRMLFGKFEEKILRLPYQCVHHETGSTPSAISKLKQKNLCLHSQKVGY